MSYKRIPSSEFRITFARIAEPVVVTSLGRAIGVWTPVGEMVNTMPTVTSSSPSVAGAVPPIPVPLASVEATSGARATSGGGSVAGMSQASKDKVLAKVRKG